MARVLRLLALAPAGLAALRTRAGPDPLASLPEPQEVKEVTTPPPNYLRLGPAHWTASQMQEEMATNFTGSELFMTKLKRWCKRDEDIVFCELKNKVSHYCPALYSAAPAVVNRSDLVASMLEFIEAPEKEIWSRDELVSEGQLKEILQLSLLQTAGNPFKKLKKQLSETPTQKPKEEPKKTGKDRYNELAAEKFAHPFPEVTETELYKERVSEHCRGLMRAKLDMCKNDARSSLLCLAMGKAAMKHSDFATIGAKMQEHLKTLPELNFRL